MHESLEIGAGTGALTLALLEAGADLTAIEIDPDLVALLRSRDDLARAHNRASRRVGRSIIAWSQGGDWHVAGNLPYNVATAVMLRLIEMEDGPIR